MRANRRHPDSRDHLPVLAVACGAAALGLLFAGCTPPREGPVDQPRPVTAGIWHEAPAPDGPWRPHVLERCQHLLEESGINAAQEGCLATCRNLFKQYEGSDAIMELELCLQDHGRCDLVLLTLGQLYMMAGRGMPELLPSEGPAGDVGHWPTNQRRLLDRAEALLTEAAQSRLDDGMIDYLRADIARARGDTSGARQLVAAGREKCSLPRSIAILAQYQHLNRYGAKMLAGVSPEYPAKALAEEITGEVVVDLLVNPAGRVVQVAPVSSPHRVLTRAAATAFLAARVQPAKIGKYPLWSWLRAKTRFSLGD